MNTTALRIWRDPRKGEWTCPLPCCWASAEETILSGVRFTAVCALAIALLCGCATSTSYVPLRPEQSLQIRNLAIVVEGEPRFTHIDTRSKAPVIAGMIFGVLGDAAVSAHKEAGYQRTADSMAPSAGEFSCRQMFARGLLETLQKAGRFRSVELVAEHSEAKVAKGFDTLAVFQIQRWGSRVQDTGADKLMLFVEVHTTMTRLGENRAIWTDTQVLAREARHTIEEYQQRNELMKTDIAEVVTNAGQRMATLLLSR